MGDPKGSVIIKIIKIKITSRCTMMDRVSTTSMSMSMEMNTLKPANVSSFSSRFPCLPVGTTTQLDEPIVKHRQKGLVLEMRQL